MNTHNGKGEARLAVEEVLRTSTRENPITASEVARITGLRVELVRTHISNCVHLDEAHNVNKPGQYGAAYAWGMRPDSNTGPVVQARTSIWHGTYTGEKPSPIRNGAMDAFSLPSRHGDSAVERKRPICIGMRPEVRP